MAFKCLLRQLRFSNSNTCSWCLACTITTLDSLSYLHFDCLRPLTFSNLCWLACRERDTTGNMASIWCAISQNPYNNQWKTCQKRRCCNKCYTTLQRKSSNFLQQRCCMSCKSACISLSGEKRFISNERRIHLKAGVIFLSQNNTRVHLQQFSCSFVIIIKQLPMTLSRTPRKQDVLPAHF